MARITIHIVSEHAYNAKTLACKGKDLVFWWDGHDFDEKILAKQYSIPEHCERYLHKLRQEFSAHIHDLAFIQIKNKALYKWFECKQTLSHWWTSLLFEKHPHMIPSLYDCFKVRTLEYMLHEYVASEHAKQQIDINLHFYESKLHSILQKYAKQFNLNLKYCKNSHKQFSFSPYSLYKKLPNFLQALIGLMRWLWRWAKSIFSFKTPDLTPYALSNQATVLAYFPNIHSKLANNGVFRSHYYENLHEILNKAVKNKVLHIHWLFIFVNSEQYEHQDCLKLKDNFAHRAKCERRNEDFHFLEEFLSIKDVLRAICNFFCFAVQSFRLEKDVSAHLGLGSMNLWPYLGKAWRESFQGWRGLERCLQRQAAIKYSNALTLNNFNHVWTLLPYENCPWERMLIAALHKNKLGKIFAYQHSCVRDADLRYFDDFQIHKETICADFLPDIYALNGQGALLALEQYLPKEKIITVEALRYLHLPRKKNIDASKSHYQRLYILTSYFPSEVDAHLRILAKWHRLYARHWQIYIKAHPLCAVDIFLKKYALNTGNVNIINKSIPNLLQKIANEMSSIGSVLWMSNSTTVSIEAAYYNLPFMVQRAKDNFNMCPLVNAFYVSNALEVEHFLQNPQLNAMHCNYFYQDIRLKRWVDLLGLANNM